MRAIKFGIILTALWSAEYCLGQMQIPTTSQGDLVVEVVNGTPDGHAIVGDMVTVRLIRDQVLVDTLQGKVNTESKVIFKNVPRGENLIATISCEHEGAPFFGQPLPLIPDHPDVVSKIQVFDVTTDISSLSIATHHIFIERAGEFIKVEEFMRLRNSALRAVKPAVMAGYQQPVVLEIFLPQGHQGFQVHDYFNVNDLIWTDEGFYDPIPVAPGEGDIRFSYLLEIDSPTLDISKKFSLPTENCTIFLSVPGIEVEGLGSPISTMTGNENQVFDFYQAGPRESGDITNFRLVGFAQKKADPTWIILILVFLAVIGIAFWRIKTSRN